MGQSGEGVDAVWFRRFSNRRLQVKGGFLPAVIKGVRHGPLAGGGQRPRLLFERFSSSAMRFCCSSDS